MAKSLRSKWKRKMKTIKRIRYGDKELTKLKDMCDKRDAKEKANTIGAEDKDIEMKVIGSVVAATDVDMKEPMTTRSSKSLLDEFGHYPQWMNQRQIKKHQNKRKVKRLKAKNTKSKRK
ncbi:unnamed protein product [Medioppia subpectinata]|uniref:Protein LLP homolog n=1 Tax=Medioppia subpectinata TaxID=1979941 RepID=A0A7R9L4M1_9ACAR|nr:unnamed protein product [Medioppia subpectinata]CAG2115198.1 unnamed protein product [Medioppia subpectinata]